MKTNLKKGDKVIVHDAGLAMLFDMMKKFGENPKPNNQGWVEDIYDDGTILIKFPIGDDSHDEHSQVTPYPLHLVEKNDW